MKKLLLASMLMGMVGFAFAQEGSKTAPKQKRHALAVKKTADVAVEKKKANDALIQQKIAADKTGTPIQQPLVMRTKATSAARKAKTN